MNNNFARSIFVITKDCGRENIEMISQPIIDFANKIDMNVSIGYTANGELICDADVDGRTSAYCKGCISEIKDMLKTSFNCKINTNFQAW